MPASELIPVQIRTKHNFCRFYQCGLDTVVTEFIVFYRFMVFISLYFQEIQFCVYAFSLCKHVNESALLISYDKTQKSSVA